MYAVSRMDDDDRESLKNENKKKFFVQNYKVYC